MKKIAQGAEAVLYREENLLIKDRIKKGYRIPEIDMPLRKSRTRLEANLLSEARRRGINTPKVFEAGENEIKMEFIDGRKMKEVFNSESMDVSEKERLAEEIGRIAGILHSNDIIHGDLTTSNMILKDDKTKSEISLSLHSSSNNTDKIYLIDFGLGFFSKRNEDKAVDLSVLKEALKSTHFKDLKMLWENIIKGYNKENKNAKEVLKTLERIELRGRYVKRE